MAACSNEDAEPEVVSLLLSAYECDPNIQARPRGGRWTAIRYCAKILANVGAVKRGGLVIVVFTKFATV